VGHAEARERRERGQRIEHRGAGAERSARQPRCEAADLAVQREVVEHDASASA
jgi:hypothetical protein